MDGNLEYYKIKSSYKYQLFDYKFYSDKEYLKVGENLLINDDDIIRKIDIDNYFTLSKKVSPIKTVIFINKNEELNFHCTVNKKYFVYAISVYNNYKKYQILNDNFQLEYVIDSCFRDFIKKENEMTEEYFKKLFLKECLVLINNQNKKKNFLQRIYMKFAKKTEIMEYEKIRKQNNLPLEILGKIKKIENYIQILECQNYSEDILKLLKTNINLALLITFEGNDTQLIEKINNYLDTTLEYIQSLEMNKQLFNEEVELKVTENIMNILDDNESIMKELIKENEKN